MNPSATVQEARDLDPAQTFLGHPRGLFVLFFVEMWERFSYYGMRALLVFYMTKGFMQLDDTAAYGIYGAYTALVYATPFIGGMLADRLLGARRAVILGGLLMAAGHLLMTIEEKTAFSAALALLICGNGFFKPNISTMIGGMYPEGSPKRDGGFTIFYMGINLGAAMSPLVCGYVGEKYGWHYGFGLATIGMLAGLMTFVANRGAAQVLIGLTAAATCAGMVYFGRDDLLMLGVNAPIGIALLVAACVSIAALMGGGLPEGLGAPKAPQRLSEPLLPGLPVSKGASVYIGTAISAVLITLLVQNRSIAGLLLSVFGGLALVLLLVDAIRSEKVERERLFVVMILMFFSMLFWAFFEQAGSSLNNFADRNVARIAGGTVLSEADVGKELAELEINSAFCGRTIDGKKWSLTDVEAAQKKATTDAQTASQEAGSSDSPRVVAKLTNVTVTKDMIGLPVAGTEIKASIFQAVNPVCIVGLGLVFSMLWSFLGKLRMEPNSAVKFSLGLLQLGGGFAVLWYGAKQCDAYGMVGMSWLIMTYVLHTTGELCLSPVGLSMVTKLSPARIVSTVMGAWFLATAFSNYLAGMIATLTGVGGHGDGGDKTIPLPIDTVHVYGEVFGKIAIAACISGVVLLVISPLLVKWMHGGESASEGKH